MSQSRERDNLKMLLVFGVALIFLGIIGSLFTNAGVRTAFESALLTGAGLILFFVVRILKDEGF